MISLIALPWNPELTSRTEDFPLLCEPITVIWGRSYNVSLIGKESEQLTMLFATPIDAKTSCSWIVSFCTCIAKVSWTDLVDEGNELLIHYGQARSYDSSSRLLSVSLLVFLVYASLSMDRRAGAHAGVDMEGDDTGKACGQVSRSKPQELRL